MQPGGTFVIANELDGTLESDREMERVIGAIRIHTSEDLKHFLADAGFVNINDKHGEGNRFICVTAQKPK